MISGLSRTSKQLLTWIGVDRDTFLGKFGQDVLWNVASFAVMAACGVSINLIIGRWYSAEALGVFNQTYSVYVIVSQFAVAGVHLSVVKYVAEYAHDAGTYRKINTAALLLAGFFAFISSAALWLLRDQIGRLFDSPGIAQGIALIAPGLFFFSINKVFLSIFNGLSRMRIYAVFQTLRYLLIVSGLLLLAIFHAPSNSLVLTFTLAELILLLCMLPVIFPEFALTAFRTLRPWLRAELDFGLRSFLSNVLLQMNTRVDVLVLGLFWDDHTVGIYSFAAILIDGIFQLPIVLRTNYNPLLVRLISAGKLDELKIRVRKGVRVTYAAMVVISLSVLLCYPLGALVVSDPNAYLQSWPVLAILSAGLLFASGYIPFSNLLLAAGRPGLHTLLTAAWVLVNILLNLWLAPLYGVWGAAVGTALSYVWLVVLVKVTTKMVVGVRI